MIVPSVAGKTIADATTTLENAGFNVAIGSEWNSSISKGLVAGSEPGGGVSYGSGNTVYIHPSTGYVPPPPKKKGPGKKKGNGGGNNGGGNGGGNNGNGRN